MATKIESKIVSYRVVPKEEFEKGQQKLQEAEIVLETPPTTMNFDIEREGVLVGKTYKVKPVTCNNSYYITLNSQVVGGKAYPREIFVSSKDIEHFEYLAALTRLISAIFRRGGDVSFIVEELSDSPNPRGGYWGKDRKTGKGKYYNSVLGEIGAVIQEYLDDLNVENSETVEEAVEMIHVALSSADHYIENGVVVTPVNLTSAVLDCGAESLEYIEEPTYPENATTCPSCHIKAAVVLDGCLTCLECGHSKCG